MRRYKQTKSNGVREWIEQFMSMRDCLACNGTRLKKESLAVLLDGKNLGDISAMSVKNLQEFLKRFNFQKKMSK